MKKVFLVLLIFSILVPVLSSAEDEDCGFIADDPTTVIIAPNPISDLSIISDTGFTSYKTDEDRSLDVYTNRTINFDIVLPADVSEMKNIFLILSVYDVDSGSVTPEIDKVYLNDHYLGNLTGNNDSWSFTTFPLDQKWLKGFENGQPGINTVKIEIDSVGRNTFWVLCDWGAIKANIGFQVLTIRPQSSLGEDLHEIKIKFNEQLDVTSLEGNVTLTYREFNEVRDIRCRFEYIDDEQVIILTPLDDLTYGVEYTISVNTGITNKEGVNLKSCRTSSFVPLPQLR